jgi:oxygen-dependent protoporphyrinogen oxidase
MYPLRLPLPLRTRLSFGSMGFRLRLWISRLKAVTKRSGPLNRAAAAELMLAFEDHRTLTDLVGRLNDEGRCLLRAFTERSGADPDEMSAGHGLRSFADVWIKGAPGRNLIGGSSLLPAALASELGNKLRLGRQVVQLRRETGGVVVSFRFKGVTSAIAAKAAIVATPAFVTEQIMTDLPAATRSALGRVRYGPFLTAAVLTDETTAMPWDRVYAISTPGRSFSVLFNMATALRHGPRLPGGSIMLFRGAHGARKLMANSDEFIERTLVNDLVSEFPEIKNRVRDVAIKRWEAGAPFSFPGRAALQNDLVAPLGRVALAGDYLEFPNMESAVASGEAAALKITPYLSP